MAGFLLLSVAFGATLRVDAKLPTEVVLDGRKVAEVWEPARLSLEVPAGAHVLRVYRAGNPTDLQLTFAPEQTIDVVVGRTGVTATPGAVVDPAADEEPAGDVTVELRALQATQVRIGRERLVLGDGEDRTLDLPVGTHPISVRNPAGTVIWAKGQLVVQAGSRIVMQIASGRMPEVSGSGRFDPGAR